MKEQNMGGEILKGKIKRKQIAGMNLIYKWHTFEYFLDAMEELGFESIFLWGGPPHFDCDYLSYPKCGRIQKAVRHHGLEITGFLVTGSNYRYQIATEEPDQREHVFNYFRNGILACEELGSPCISMNSGWGYQDHDREEAFKRSRDMISRLCEEARKHHVRIVLESLKSCETNLVVTMEDMKRMEREVNHPAFSIMADTGAIGYNKERLEDWFDCFGKQIRSIHFVDGMHLTWGDGKSGLDDMIKSIITHEYQGCLALETSGSAYLPDPIEADRKAMRILSPFLE